MAKTKTSIETFKLTPSQVADSIRRMRNTKIATFIWGPPGIAKSEVGMQVATMEGIAFIDMRLSQMDPTDLRGIPCLSAGGMRWIAPAMLPRDLKITEIVEIDAIDTFIEFTNPLGKNDIHYCTDPKITVTALNKAHTAEIVEETFDSFTVIIKDENNEVVSGKVQFKVTGKCFAIMALEEFNSAPQSVQAAAYELVLDRRQGEYIVPEGVTMVAMGNREQDKGIAYKMGTAISNRFVHVEMVPHFEDWQTWALGKHESDLVVGFLTAFKNKLFQFEPGSAARGFATPRSWHFVSEILKKNEDMPELVMLGLLTGAVGDGAGVEFMAFRDIAKSLPPTRKILDGTIKQMPEDKKNDVALAYALTTALSYELKNDSDAILRKFAGNMKNLDKSPEMANWFKEADFFLEFLMKNFPEEISIMGTKASIQVHKLPFDTQRMSHFKSFAIKYKDLIMG